MFKARALFGSKFERASREEQVEFMAFVYAELQLPGRQAAMKRQHEELLRSNGNLR